MVLLQVVFGRDRVIDILKISGVSFKLFTHVYKYINIYIKSLSQAFSAHMDFNTLTSLSWRRP